MPGILSCPNEILYRIVKDVPRVDLLSLALCNKSLSAVTQGALKEHVALRERYNTLTFGRYDDDFRPHPYDDTKNALLFLGHIIEDPEIAYYPTELQIGEIWEDGISDFEIDQEVYDCRQAVTGKHSNGLKTLIEECDFILDKENMFVNLLDPLREDVALALLLANLPNLQSIKTQIPSHGIEIQCIEEIVERMAWANRDATLPSHGKALTQLRDLYVGVTDDQIGYGGYMEYFESFAMLPSMRTLRGHTMYSDGYGWPKDFLVRSSNVTEICLDRSAINSDEFEALFSGISALAKFKYTHYYEPPSEDAIYDPAGIVKALRKHAASTLQSLDLEGSRLPLLCSGGSQLVGSLRMFTALKYLRTEDLAFELPWRGISARIQSSEDDEAEPKTETEDEEHTMERLVDLLPRSIEHLTLIQFMAEANEELIRMGMDEANMEDLLRDMAVLKTERVPRLQMIRFESSNSITPEKRTTLKKSGLKASGVTLSWDVKT